MRRPGLFMVTSLKYGPFLGGCYCKAAPLVRVPKKGPSF